MKTPTSIHRYLKAIAPLSLLLAASPLQAAVYTGAAGNWSVSTNWSGGVPNGVGATVSRTAGSTVTLTQDIASVTVGTISLTGTGAFTITTGTNALTLDGGGAGAIIENASTGALAQLMLTTSSNSSFVIADDLQVKQSDANSTVSGTAVSGTTPAPKFAIQISQRLVGTKSITISNVLNDLNYGLVSFGGGNPVTGSYTGAFTLTKGAMTWTSNTAFGATSGITLGSTGGGDVSFATVSSQATVAANITVAANTAGKTVLGSIVTSGTQKFTGNIALNQNLTVISQMTTADSTGVQLDGTLSGTGGLQINGTVKISGASADTAGIVKMSGTNTFTGDTRVYKGTLLLGAASGTTSKALQNSTLNLDGSDSGTVGFGVNSSTTITAATIGGLAGSRTLALQNIATTPAAVALSVGNNNQDTTYTGALTGAGSLTKIGTGKLILGGSSTYTGATGVNAGTLQIGDGTSGSIASAGVTVGSGATLAFNQANSSTYSGAITNNGAIRMLSSYQNTLSGNVGGSGSFAQVGSGTTVLGGSNTYTGSTAVTSGELSVNGSLGASSTVNVSGGATLSGSGIIKGAANINASTINGNNLTVEGITKFDGASFLKGHTTANAGYNVNTGSLTVSGTTGSGVNVASGAILQGSGQVGSVSVSGTLAGTLSTGVLSGSGVVSPGNSPGILTTTSLAAGNSLSFAFELATTAPNYASGTNSLNDVLHVTQSSSGLNLSSSNHISVYFSSLNSATLASSSGSKFEGTFYVEGLSGASLLAAFESAQLAYYVIDGDSTVDATDVTFNGTRYALINSILISVTSTNDGLSAFGTGSSASTLEFTVVPEPGTWAMLLGGVGMLAFGQRMRRRN